MIKLARALRLGPALLAGAWLSSGPPATATTVFVNNQGGFVAALSDSSVLTFDTAPLGNITGNEFAAAGFLFSSPVSGAAGQLSIQPPSFFASSRYLNVGEIPFTSGDGDQDDLTVQILGTHRAFGFGTVDNAGGGGESITVFGVSGVIHVQPDIPQSFGIIADEPIVRVVIDERSDGDDVGYDDFRLGNSTVPELAALVMLGAALAGLAAIIGLRRNRTGGIAAQERPRQAG